MAKQRFNVTITREVTYTVSDVLANTPEEAELIAEEQLPTEFDLLPSAFGDTIQVETVPSEDDE
jgi:hypothetical protein